MNGDGDMIWTGMDLCIWYSMWDSMISNFNGDNWELKRENKEKNLSVKIVFIFSNIFGRFVGRLRLRAVERVDSRQQKLKHNTWYKYRIVQVRET